MNHKKGYKSIPLSINRRAVIASASVTRDKNVIHSFADIDITEPRRLINENLEKTVEKLSFTAYIVTCLAQTIKEHPQLNSFIKGRKLITLNDIIVSVLIERDIAGEKVPEPIGIKETQHKTVYQIHNEIKEAKKIRSDKLGSLSGKTWIRLIPTFLLKTFLSIMPAVPVMPGLR